MGGRKTINNEGTRLKGMQIQDSTYGGAIPLLFGMTRLTGSIIDYVDFKAIANTTSQNVGKGGGTTIRDTNYTYQVAAIIALCAGSIVDVKRVWVNKDIVDLEMSVFKGDGQQPWLYMNGAHPERALVYKNLAYVADDAFALGTDGSMPNFSFEVQQCVEGTDLNPADIFSTLLMDQNIGLALPVQYISMQSIANFSDYCLNQGLQFSLAMQEQQPARDWLQDLVEAANAEFVWSAGTLKIIPCVWTTPVYDLTDDDFLASADGPVTITLGTGEQGNNTQTIEFLNRATEYAIETVEVKDLANIECYGVRAADVRKMPFICLPNLAAQVAQTILQHKLYSRKEYGFKLGWKYCLLEPMDIVTLTDVALGLDKTPVRIISIEENQDNGELNIMACECPNGAETAFYYPREGTIRARVNNYDSLDSVQTPVIFELPFTVSGEYQLGIAVCGQTENWGGAYVWLSFDGETYAKIGEITAPSRYGKLVSDILSTDMTLIIQLNDLNAQLLSVSIANPALCKVGMEWITFETAVLLAAGRYALSGVQRGLYNSIAADHLADVDFVRYDSTGFLYPYKTSDIGRTFYVKLTSYNVFKTKTQELDDVSSYAHTIKPV